MMMPANFSAVAENAHAGVDEQKAGVVLGDEGKAGETEMALGLKELEEHLAEFVDSILLHGKDLQRKDMGGMKKPPLASARGGAFRGTTLMIPPMGDLSFAR